MKVKAGDVIPEWVMESVSAARMRTMAALLRDPNPVHWDRNVVNTIGLGKRTINQGPLGLSYMINMLHAWAGENSIKRIITRFPKPLILDDDKIISRGVVTEVREENGVQIAICETWLEKEGERGLIEATATVQISQEGSDQTNL